MNVRLDDIIVTKSGDSNGGENCALYGQNAALLAKDGSVVTIKKAQVVSTAKGANGVFSYGGSIKGKGDGTRIDIADSSITTSGDNSGGIMTTGGGETNASELTINTSGQSSAPIRSYKGGGKVVVNGGTYISTGSDSPAVYSMADITVKDSTLTSHSSSGVTIHGKNKVSLQNCVLTANNHILPYRAECNTGVMMYDDDHTRGTAEFTMNGGTFNNITGSMFHITNTKAKIILDDVNLNNTDENDVFLDVSNDGWGGSENAANVEIRNMKTGGRIIVDNSPKTVGKEGSSLTLTLASTTIFTGSINDDILPAHRGSVNLVVRQGCRFILNKTSYIDSLTNNGRIICGDYDLYVNGEKYDDGGSDYPTESTLILDDTSYILEDETGKIQVYQDSHTKAILATIRDSGWFMIKGSGINTVLRVARGVTGVRFFLSDLTIDNTTYAETTSSDSPIILLEEGSEAEITTLETTTLISSEDFKAEPQALIKGNNSSILFDGSGVLVLKDSMSTDANFTDHDPSDAINNPGGNITFKSSTLNITTNGSAAKAKAGIIAVTGGTVNVGYAGRDAVVAKDGTVNVTTGRLDVSECYGDGINAEVESSTSIGTVNIVDGSVRLYKIYGDGINAENVNITGGDVTITTMFETSADGYFTTGNNVVQKNTIFQMDNQEITRINVFIGYHCGIRVGRRGKTYSYLYVHSSDPKHKEGVIYTQAATGSLNISGGTIVIDTKSTGLKTNVPVTPGYTPCSTGIYIIGSPGDGMKSYNTIAISGGNIEVSSGGDGIHCDGTVSITGPAKINIPVAYEGIQGADVIIGTDPWPSTPELTIDANDNGIRTISSTFNYTYDDSRNEDYNYTKKADNILMANDVYMYSGKLDIDIDCLKDKTAVLRTGSGSSYAKKTVHYKALGHCLDCEGLVHVEKGEFEVFGQSDPGKIPVETNDGFAINKRAIALVTGIAPNDESRPRFGDCAFIKPRDVAWTADAFFRVRTKEGDTIYQNQLRNAGSFLIFAHPMLVAGTAYDVTIGDNTYSIKAYNPS